MTLRRPSDMAVIDCASRSALVPGPAISLGQLVTILSSLMPCAIAGAGKLPAAATAAVAPSSTSRRRVVIWVSLFARPKMAPVLTMGPRRPRESARACTHFGWHRSFASIAPLRPLAGGEGGNPARQRREGEVGDAAARNGRDPWPPCRRELPC